MGGQITKKTLAGQIHVGKLADWLFLGQQSLFSDDYRRNAGLLPKLDEKLHPSDVYKISR